MERFRIVSVCPSNTEMICALGLGEYLVGVDHYSDYPEAIVQSLPDLGPDLQIDIERVKSLQPDLVVSSLSVPGMERVVQGLGEADLPQVALSPHRIKDIYQDLRTLASCVPDSILPAGRVEAVIDQLQARVARITHWLANRNVAHPAERQRPRRLYWEWWPSPVFSPARNNWLTEISQLAGAVNIFGHLEGDAVQDDGTQVAKAEPDVMLAVWTGIPQDKVPVAKIVGRGSPWTDTPAFRHRQIYILNEGLYCRPSPRLIDGLEQLVGLLYPDAIHELGLPSPHSLAPIRTCYPSSACGSVY